MPRIILFSLCSIFILTNQLRAWESELFTQDWDPSSLGTFYSDKLLQDFSYAGYQLGEDPPQIEDPVFNVLDYGAVSGSGDDLEAIQATIDAAKAVGGGVIYLPEGLYEVELAIGRSIRIDTSNIVLRGDGPNKTRIQFSGTSYRQMAGIVIQGTGGTWYNERNPSTLLSMDIDRPTAVIPVQSIVGFEVGQLVVIRSDTTIDWLAEHNQADRWTPATLNAIVFLRKITRIDPAAKTVTIDIPIRYSLWTRDNARIYRAPEHISQVGLEDFAFGFIEHTGSGFGENDYTNPERAAYDLHDSYGIRFQRVIDSWMRRVETFQPVVNTRARSHIASNGVVAWESARLHIEDCHFSRPQFGGGGGNGYMFRFSANDVRLVNCTASESRHGFVFWRPQASGNVLERCTDRLTGYQCGASGRERTAGSGSDHHGLFSIANLTDLCIGEDSYFDAFYRGSSSLIHDLTATHSVYWNTKGKTLERPLGHLVRSQQARYGYIIGTSGDVSNARTDGSSSDRTAPLDHVEGIGIGDSISPQSLSAAMRAYRELRPSAYIKGLFLQTDDPTKDRQLKWGDLLETSMLPADWRITAEVDGDYDFLRVEMDFVPMNPSLIFGTSIAGQNAFANEPGLRLLKATPYQSISGRAYPGEPYFLQLAIYEFAPGFRQWQQRLFNEAQLADATISGYAADPDNDKLSNLVEYSMGANPLIKEKNSPFYLMIIDEQVHYRYLIRNDLEEVSFNLQRSFDLQSWSAAPLIDNNLLEENNGIQLRGGRLPYSQTRNANFYRPVYDSLSIQP